MERILETKKGEGYLITDKLYRKYFSGIDVDEGFLLMSKQTTYFADARYFSAVKDKLENSSIKCVLYKDLNSLKTQLKEQKIKTVYLDYESTTLAEYQSYKGLGIKLKNGTEKLLSCREIKTQAEISNLEKSCKIIEEVISSIPSLIKVGITEKEISDYIERQVILRGAEGVSFPTIVAFGSHAAVPHHQTSDTPLKENQCVLIDAGCVYNGYCSDITRTFFYGTPSNKFKECYSAVQSANMLAYEFIKEGESLSRADGVARDYLESQKMGEFFTHSLGHGVGLAIHEQPRLSKKAQGVFKENMVFTIEPGVYYNGEFGIRIEDTVILKDKKAQRLYSDSKDLIIIDIK